MLLGKYLQAHKKFHISQLLLQVFFVGATLGLFRTVVPALSESRFGVPAGDFFLLASFIVVFGLIKSVFNFLSSYFSDHYGRKRMLVTGWLIALPIPWIVAHAPDWTGIILATFLLGVNQGLCWSMSQIMKIDLTPRRRHGLMMGMNETLGYCGVAISAYLSTWLTVNLGSLDKAILWMGTFVVLLALIDSLLFCGETRPAPKEKPAGTPVGEATGNLFIRVSFRHMQTMSLCLAGLVEKFVDVLVWLIYPVFLYRQNIALLDIALITGVYAATWGILQIFTGSASDKFGRRSLIVSGMFLCALGCVATLLSMQPWWWVLNAFVIGIGMAMLYPTLGATVSDYSSVARRGAILGIYRFWRDAGYFFGALLFAAIATFSQEFVPVFVATSVCMVASALFVAITIDNFTGQLSDEKRL